MMQCNGDVQICQYHLRVSHSTVLPQHLEEVSCPLSRGYSVIGSVYCQYMDILNTDMYLSVVLQMSIDLCATSGAPLAHIGIPQAHCCW